MSDFLPVRGRPVSISFVGCPSLARQEFGFDADMNNIIKRYHRTGVLPVLHDDSDVIDDGCALPGDFAEACEAAFDDHNKAELFGNHEQLTQEAPKETQESPKDAQEAPKDAKE